MRGRSAAGSQPSDLGLLRYFRWRGCTLPLSLRPTISAQSLSQRPPSTSRMWRTDPDRAIRSDRAHHPPETDVTRGRVDRLRVAGGRAVATTVIRRAQERAALEDLARDADFGLTTVVALLDACATRIAWNAASLLS